MPNPQEMLDQAIALHQSGRLAEAEALYRQILAIDPDHAGALQLLGAMAHQRGQHGVAIELIQRSLSLDPGGKQTLNNLGEALRAVGDVDGSIAAFRKALELDANYVKAHSNLLLTLHFHPWSTGGSLRREHERWARQHADRFVAGIAPHANDSASDRVLRIGYVSPDFKTHSVAYFIEPVIRAHRRDRVRVFCYSNTITADGVTQRIQAWADEWRDITRLDDDAAAEMVRQDRIDVLVDLTGHTARNRLLLFARKPAPVQATWLGYPNGTGMSQIDYRLSDAIADPPGMTESHYVERVMRLPDCAWLYQPPADAPPPAPPGDRPITFGSFNKFPKVSAGTMALWSRILAAVPNSRLVVKAKSLADPSTREIALGMLQSHGIGPDRVEISGWTGEVSDHLSRYNQIDVALDPFPYNGTTTTCEALWMGVPVVTLAGPTHVSRVGASLLNAVGLNDLVAKTQEEYFGIAVELADSPQRRAELRRSLREKMTRSPLMDSGAFVGQLEDAYRRMWQEWCNK